MNKKVLVAYASKAGSTMEVAQALGEELTQRGYAVDVMPFKKVTNLDSYSAFVLGSAIRIGSWLPEAAKFVEQHQAELASKPTALFAVHLNNLGDDPASREARQAYLAPQRKLITPISEALFAGVGDLSKLSFLERMISKAVKSPEGDFRDWTAIRGWGQSILA